jgi:SWI/SNF-related matrix-associated actin-dependent regulator of chromatin subfamily A protein 2/4
MLSGEDAPLASQLQAWLEVHQGWEAAPREDEEDDSEDVSDDEEDKMGTSNSTPSNFGNLTAASLVTFGFKYIFT